MSSFLSIDKQSSLALLQNITKINSVQNKICLLSPCSDFSWTADFLLDWGVQFCAYRSTCLLAAFLDYKLIFLPCSLALRSTILHRNWWKWFRWVIPQNMLSPSTRTMKKCADRTATFASSARFKHLLDNSFINRLIISYPEKQSIDEKSKI